MPPYQRLALKSFIDFGHQYALYGYRKFDVPSGVALRDANQILPESRVFFYGTKAGLGRGSVAAFSNLFRYHMLDRVGGWWVDADVICLSDTVPAVDTFLGWEDERTIGSAILRFPARHWLVQELRDAVERAGTDLDWGATGPRLLTRVACERGLSARPQSTSYPVRAKDALQLLMPEHRDVIRQKTAQAPFLHLWNEVMRRAVVFSWMAPPPGSFIAELCERHGVGFDGAPVYTAEQVRRLNENYSSFAFGDARSRQNLLLQSEVESLQAQLRAVKFGSKGRDEELMSARESSEMLAREVTHLEARVAALQASTSWRLTAPLRSAAGLFRALVRKPSP